mmetsp:Transcript_2735/g.9237  ORF Transcript_2735/g.9237 Transcript_2735/m.9237 type:complete len:281 (+) Transcript_2735:97-939(+)|eukprot:scaffold1072_cov118-Isochrysis_galbana.AAC.4
MQGSCCLLRRPSYHQPCMPHLKYLAPLSRQPVCLIQHPHAGGGRPVSEETGVLLECLLFPRLQLLELCARALEDVLEIGVGKVVLLVVGVDAGWQIGQLERLVRDCLAGRHRRGSRRGSRRRIALLLGGQLRLHLRLGRLLLLLAFLLERVDKVVAHRHRWLGEGGLSGERGGQLGLVRIDKRARLALVPPQEVRGEEHRLVARFDRDNGRAIGVALRLDVRGGRLGRHPLLSVRRPGSDPHVDGVEDIEQVHVGLLQVGLAKVMDRLHLEGARRVGARE